MPGNINQSFISTMRRFAKRACIFSLKKTNALWPDKLFLKFKYRLMIGKKLNLKNPSTFNEKLQWLKLYDRNPSYTRMVDKVDVKEYVAEKIGQEYIIPTLGIWESADDIDFDLLPEKFVIKCNHNSGQGIYICTDKKQMDVEKVRNELRLALQSDYYLQCREWPYKDVHRRIIAEKFLEDTSSEDGDLRDYKFMCFNGIVKSVFVCTERKKSLKVTFFDRNWKRLPFERHYPQSAKIIPQPSKFEEMVQLAEILSKDIPFVRVDFYEVNGQIYFGELTFYPGAGFEEFNPVEWDGILGSWIDIK